MKRTSDNMTVHASARIRSLQGFATGAFGTRREPLNVMRNQIKEGGLMHWPQIRQRFVDEVVSWSERRGYEVVYPAGPKSFLRVQGNGSHLLYVKVWSKSGGGFWGVNNKRLQKILRNEDDWSVVLLRGSAGKGYLIPGLSAIRLTCTSWTLASDGDYKVHEREEVQRRFAFECTGEPLERIAGRGI